MSKVVTGPLAVVKLTTGQLAYVYDGGAVPADADPEHVQHLESVGLVGDASADEATSGEPEATQAPAKSAAKAEWVEYAVSQGASHGDAEAATKEELVERYG